MADTAILAEAAPPPRLDLATLPAYQASLDCVHCGFCLESCPTYRVTGLEPSSPRGRIHLMRSYAEGRIGLEGESARHLDDCLGCRACETVCPAGVRYAEMFELVRDVRLDRQSIATPPSWSHRARDLALDVLPHANVTRLVATALALYQRTGLRSLARRLGLPRLLGPRLRMMEALAPAEPPSWRRILTRRGSASSEIPARGSRLGRVALFRGCIGDALFGEVNDQAARLLALYSYDVVVAPDATCCGALDLHAGRHARALALARRNLDAFGALGLGETGGVEWVASTSAGCGAMLRDLSRHFREAPAARDLARAFESRVRDVTELLVAGRPAEPPGSLELSVTYDAPCHLLHAQRVSHPPLALIRSIPGVRFVALRGAELCCGSAGLYNLLHPEMAQRVLEEKLAAIRETGAAVLITGNPGCSLHIAAGARGASLPIEILHPVTLLARAHGLT